MDGGGVEVGPPEMPGMHQPSTLSKNIEVYDNGKPIVWPKSLQTFSGVICGKIPGNGAMGKM